MTLKVPDIYKQVARNNGLDQELVASVGDYVFKALMNKMISPDSLAYELDHVGTFAVRHKNFIKKYAKLPMGDPFLSSWEVIPEMILNFRDTKELFKQRKEAYEKAK